MILLILSSVWVAKPLQLSPHSLSVHGNLYSCYQSSKKIEVTSHASKITQCDTILTENHHILNPEVVEYKSKRSKREKRALSILTILLILLQPCNQLSA